jgi:hypothetical protein
VEEYNKNKLKSARTVRKPAKTAKTPMKKNSLFNSVKTFYGFVNCVMENTLAIM